MKSYNQRMLEINNRVIKYKNNRKKITLIAASSLCCILCLVLGIVLPFTIKKMGGNDFASLHSLYVSKSELFNKIHSTGISNTTKRLIADDNSSNDGSDDSNSENLIFYENQEKTLEWFENSNLLADGVISCLTLNYNEHKLIVSVEYDKSLSFAERNEKMKYFMNNYSKYLNSINIYNVSFKNYGNVLFLNLMNVYDIFVCDITLTNIGYLSNETKTFIKLTSSEAEITIPNGIETIAANAFYVSNETSSLIINSFTEKVILPEGLKAIESGAFYNCTALTEINLPNSIEFLGDHVFASSSMVSEEPKLLIEKLPENLTSVGMECFSRTLNYSNFQNDSLFIIDNWVVGQKGYMHNVSIPEGIIGICYRLLFYTKITSIYIPDSVKFIGDEILPSSNVKTGNIGVFVDSDRKETWSKNCFKVSGMLSIKIHVYYNYTTNDVQNFNNKLANQGALIRDEYYYNGTSDEIYINENVEFLEPKAFYFTNAKSFVVSENNPHFKSVDGVIYSKDGTVLVAYPNRKDNTEFTIPETVTTIADYAFNNVKLKEIYISNNIETIGEGAFYFWNSSQTIKFEHSYAPLNWDYNWDISNRANKVWKYK